MQIDRPLDFLGAKKGKEILIQLKETNGLVKGKLLAFDINLNIVLEIKSIPRFFRGNNIIWIE